MSSYKQAAVEYVSSIPTDGSNSLSSTSVNHVQIDGLVVLKIVKHAEDERKAGIGELAQGYLCGMIAVDDRRLEVTNCFVKPVTIAEEDDTDESQSYQETMLKKFRQVNYDYMTVGFYQCAPFGACFNEHFLYSCHSYQTSVSDSVVLVYDPVKTTQGLLSIKAYRLNEAALAMCNKDWSPEAIQRAEINYETLFEELPVSIKNSHLINICLAEVQLEQRAKPTPPTNFLDLGFCGNIERSMKQLMGNIDSMNSEVVKFNRYQSQKLKQEAAKESHVQKRSLENEARKARGEPALPDDDVSKLFKQLQQPSMLDGLLAASDVKSHAEHIQQMAAQNLGKLFLAKAVVEEGSST